MGELELKVPDEVEEKFRMSALAVFGDEDSPIDKAAEQAITQWYRKILGEN